VINREDPFGRRLLAERPDGLAYGTSDACPVRATAVKADTQGLRMEAVTPAGRLTVHSPLLGRVNAWNLLAAVAWSVAAGIDPPIAAEALASVAPVTGRLEPVPNSHGLLAVVDFAHNGPALEGALTSLRELTRERLIVVFGAGGNRDPERRTTMGRLAARLADVAVITSDNPRDEDPLAIVNAIEKAARASNGSARLVVEPDRTAAIEAAVKLAQPGDTLLVAGKGHERYQLIGNRRLPFDDRKKLERALDARRAAS
jgi:UDP-N-acetylmuramoyl-L-alanyl-D-glutamate--2,6-diaminopimelate ligase